MYIWRVAVPELCTAMVIVLVELKTFQMWNSTNIHELLVHYQIIT
jgi:hypothetical protein